MRVITEADPLPEQLPSLFSRQVRKARRFYLASVPLPDVPLAVVGGGHEFCSSGYAVHRPSFPYYSVEFVARGRGSLALGDREFALNAGTVFSYGPGVSHRITTDARDLLEK